MSIDTTQAHKITDLDSFKAYVTVGSIVYYQHTTDQVIDTFASKVIDIPSEAIVNDTFPDFGDLSLWVSDLYSANPESFLPKSRFFFKDVDFLYSFDPQTFKSLYPELFL